MPAPSDGVGLSRIAAVQEDTGVWGRRALSVIAWSRCHLVCHWLQEPPPTGVSRGQMCIGDETRGPEVDGRLSRSWRQRTAHVYIHLLPTMRRCRARSTPGSRSRVARSAWAAGAPKGPGRSHGPAFQGTCALAGSTRGQCIERSSAYRRRSVQPICPQERWAATFACWRTQNS